MIDLDQCNAMLEAARKGDKQALGMLADKLAESGDAAVIQGVLRRAMYLDEAAEAAKIGIERVIKEGRPSNDLERMLRRAVHFLRKNNMLPPGKEATVLHLTKIRLRLIEIEFPGESEKDWAKLRAFMQRFGIDFAPEPDWVELVNEKPKAKKE